MPESLIYAFPIIAALLASIQAIRTKSLIRSALWLAVVSAALSILLYKLGAHQVAVIELSVGAGLVTVLFVFAISIAGAEVFDEKPLLPRALPWVLVLLSTALFMWYVLPAETIDPIASDPDVVSVFWNQRGLDVIVQVVLIFSGVLGLLGVLAEVKAPLSQPMVEEVAAERERDLRALERQSAEAVESYDEIPAQTT
jgi:NADH:ubiquinone oxidoreductase subunit 6 (subunit J)